MFLINQEKGLQRENQFKEVLNIPFKEDKERRESESGCRKNKYTTQILVPSTSTSPPLSLALTHQGSHSHNICCLYYNNNSESNDTINLTMKYISTLHTLALALTVPATATAQTLSVSAGFGGTKQGEFYLSSSSSVLAYFNIFFHSSFKHSRHSFLAQQLMVTCLRYVQKLSQW